MTTPKSLKEENCDKDIASVSSHIALCIGKESRNLSGIYYIRTMV